jgi:hypothetical protein
MFSTKHYKLSFESGEQVRQVHANHSSGVLQLAGQRTNALHVTAAGYAASPLLPSMVGQTMSSTMAVKAGPASVR